MRVTLAEVARCQTCSHLLFVACRQSNIGSASVQSLLQLDSPCHPRPSRGPTVTEEDHELARKARELQREKEEREVAFQEALRKWESQERCEGWDWAWRVWGVGTPRTPARRLPVQPPHVNARGLQSISRSLACHAPISIPIAQAMAAGPGEGG